MPKTRLFSTALFFWAIALFASLTFAVVPTPPKLAAESYILTDFHSGTVLAEQNADEKLPPASLTKIMTVYVVFKELKQGNLKLDELVTVSEKAWRAPGSRMFIEVNKQVPVEDLLKGVIIQSGNDASIALAEHIAGDESTFAELMNHHAKVLGLTNTHYVNSTGLPDENHYTTAKDLARLTQALIAEFPEYYGWFSIKEFTYNGITQKNRNLLLWRDPTVDGVKTGHTEEAGYCLVASAKRDDMRLISAVMRTASENARASASQALLNYGFRFFTTQKVHDNGKPLTEVRVYKGKTETLPLGVTEPVYVTLPKGQEKNLVTELVVEPWPTAPVEKGQNLGKVILKVEDKVIAERPLIALESIEEGGLIRQWMDEAWLMIKQW